MIPTAEGLVIAAHMDLVASGQTVYLHMKVEEHLLPLSLPLSRCGLLHMAFGPQRGMRTLLLCVLPLAITVCNRSIPIFNTSVFNTSVIMFHYALLYPLFVRVFVRMTVMIGVGGRGGRGVEESEVGTRDVEAVHDCPAPLVWRPQHAVLSICARFATMR